MDILSILQSLSPQQLTKPLRFYQTPFFDQAAAESIYKTSHTISILKLSSLFAQNFTAPAVKIPVLCMSPFPLHLSPFSSLSLLISLPSPLSPVASLSRRLSLPSPLSPVASLPVASLSLYLSFPLPLFPYASLSFQLSFPAPLSLRLAHLRLIRLNNDVLIVARTTKSCAEETAMTFSSRLLRDCFRIQLDERLLFRSRQDICTISTYVYLYTVILKQDKC
jgi:hypothetical protein